MKPKTPTQDPNSIAYGLGFNGSRIGRLDRQHGSVGSVMNIKKGKKEEQKRESNEHESEFLPYAR